MPGLPSSDVVSGVLKEARRNSLRARNGVRYISGSDGAEVGTTPKDLVWRRGKALLWRYRSPGITQGPPLLAFIGLISRSFILDLYPGNSFVERLRDAGFDVFLLDWGVPDAADSQNTIETYVDDYLPSAVQALLRAADTEELTLVGYCMGGNFALLACAANQLPVRNLVTIATPVALREMGALTDALREGKLNPDQMIDDSGNVPGALLRSFFRVRKPTADLVQYANLWQNLWNDTYVRGHQAMGRWIREQPPFPGTAFRQVVDDWLRPDAFLNGELQLGGRSVDLSRIRVPALGVVAMRDEVVPPAAALPIETLLSGSGPDLLKLDAGHVGLSASRKAATVTVPAIVHWLKEHSDAS